MRLQLRPDYALIIISPVQSAGYACDVNLAHFMPLNTEFIYLGMKYECCKNDNLHSLNNYLLNN